MLQLHERGDACDHAEPGARAVHYCCNACGLLLFRGDTGEFHRQYMSIEGALGTDLWIGLLEGTPVAFYRTIGDAASVRNTRMSLLRYVPSSRLDAVENDLRKQATRARSVTEALTAGFQRALAALHALEKEGEKLPGDDYSFGWREAARRASGAIVEACPDVEPPEGTRIEWTEVRLAPETDTGHHRRSVREAARHHRPLDGADAQAMEGALSQAKHALATARSEMGAELREAQRHVEIQRSNADHATREMGRAEEKLAAARVEANLAERKLQKVDELLRAIIVLAKKPSELHEAAKEARSIILSSPFPVDRDEQLATANARADEAERVLADAKRLLGDYQTVRVEAAYQRGLSNGREAHAQELAAALARMAIMEDALLSAHAVLVAHAGDFLRSSAEKNAMTVVQKCVDALQPVAPTTTKDRACDSCGDDDPLTDRTRIGEQWLCHDCITDEPKPLQAATEPS